MPLNNRISTAVRIGIGIITCVIAVSLLPGSYRVRLLGSTPRDLGPIEIEPRSEIGLRAE